ncbi:MAG TPA: porphobilinogen synthase, partial [bacterium]|nr:porphobilinogen synthase [bacterium]
MGFPATRLRRLRATPGMRRLVVETRLSPEMLVYPVFAVEGRGVREPIAAMPGVFHLSVDELAKEAKEAAADGVGAMLIFGVPDKKDSMASGATSRDGLVPRAVSALKDALPGMLVATDVCLCGYTDHGHCGVVGKDGRIENDATLELLQAAALSHARAGADVVAPSDMMDGRVGAIRRSLDAEGFADTAIMSYAAK